MSSRVESLNIAAIEIIVTITILLSKVARFSDCLILVHELTGYEPV